MRFSNFALRVCATHGPAQDRATQERALHERREQQLAALREKERAAEEEKRQVASELRVMKVQVGSWPSEWVRRCI